MQKQYDTIVIGGGLIGLSLAWSLARKGANTLIIERREPGQEASHAGGGMIADLDPVLPTELLEIAHRSASLYPQFVSELQRESEHAIDLRENGVVAFEQHPIPETKGIRKITTEEVIALEPKIQVPPDPAYAMDERAVDPRDLVAALVRALQFRAVDMATGEHVQQIQIENGRAVGVRTDRNEYSAPAIVNCAGAWAAQIAGAKVPTIPVKGHMVALAFPHELAMSSSERDRSRTLRHVLRSRWCYIIPRSNGRYVVGSTVEPAGFDKSLNSYRVKRLQDAAARLVPSFAEAQVVEAWTGLRPGTPDNLPLLGVTSVPGYYAATGHYRDGILLAPVTAEIMSDLILTGASSLSIDRFSPTRFQGRPAPF